MPILEIVKINPSVSWAIWQIEEDINELMRLYEPQGKELCELETIKVDGRKIESIAARLALKTLLSKHGLDSGEVYKDEFGKPHVKQNGVEISISHAKGFGAAAINLDGPVGIDIEHARDQILRISRKFLHPSEQVWAKDDIGKLTKIWCAKEALYKLHGRTQLIFSEQLIVNKNLGQILESDSIQEYDLHFSDRVDFLTALAY